MVIVSAGLEIERNTKGMDICRMEGVGARRRLLGPRRAGKMSIAKAHNDAVVVLAETCRVCPFAECDMKVWPVTR